MTMARVTDIAMLFVRCAGGISHHPDESVTEDDVAAGDRSGDEVRVFDLIVRAVIVGGDDRGHRRDRRR